MILIRSRRASLLAAVAILAMTVSLAYGEVADESPLIVHEWGTFTTMQGSSGADLDGMQHETERLPSFVYSRTDSVESPFREFGDTSFAEVPRAKPVIARIASSPRARVVKPAEPAPVVQTVAPVVKAAAPPVGVCRVFHGKCEGCERGPCENPTHCHRAKLSWVGEGAGWHHDHVGSCPRETTLTVSAPPPATPTPVATATPVPPRICHGKMETPVLYFYSETERRVRVHVDFIGGLLTQWYPRESAAMPAFASSDALDLSIRRSSLDWELDLLPFGSPRPTSIPDVSKKDAWQFAREVRSAYVRTPASTGPEESDHYIFYRGLGKTEQAIRVDAYPNGIAVVRNESPDEVAAAFVLEMGEREARVVSVGALPAHSTRGVVFGSTRYAPKAEVIASLEKSVHAALVAQGLFADEATAMVRTWSSTWFGMEGTRVIYLFPRTRIDALIPLAIEPTPDEIVRVMVGRLEYMTPEAEEKIESALRDRASPDPELRLAAAKVLARRGRFLEASVRRILSITKDPAARRGAEDVLASYGR